jgi:hypothetical protein
MSDKPVEQGKRAHPRPTSQREPNALEFIEDALRGLRFGEVTVIVHDGQIVQVERIEKKRFNNNP